VFLLAWKGTTYLAMGSDQGFIKASCGYVGASDGWQDLKDNRKLDWQLERAEDANIAVIGQIDTSKTADFTLGLAFGNSSHASSYDPVSVSQHCVCASGENIAQ